MGTAPRLYRWGYGGDRAAHRELEERRPEIITRIFRGRSRDIANFRATVINCGFSGSPLMLKFPVLRLWSIASGGPMSWGEALLWGALIVAVLIAVLAAAYFLFQNFV